MWHRSPHNSPPIATPKSSHLHHYPATAIYTSPTQHHHRAVAAAQVANRTTLFCESVGLCTSFEPPAQNRCCVSGALVFAQRSRSLLRFRIDTRTIARRLPPTKRPPSVNARLSCLFRVFGVSRATCRPSSRTYNQYTLSADIIYQHRAAHGAITDSQSSRDLRRLRRVRTDEERRHNGVDNSDWNVPLWRIQTSCNSGVTFPISSSACVFYLTIAIIIIISTTLQMGYIQTCVFIHSVLREHVTATIRWLYQLCSDEPITFVPPMLLDVAHSIFKSRVCIAG